jgi:hypothetical protein
MYLLLSSITQTQANFTRIITQIMKLINQFVFYNNVQDFKASNNEVKKIINEILGTD